MAVDRLGRPLRDDPYRGNVRVYAASNITLSGLQTIDGVTLESGDRVLCNGQTTTSQNGIYVASNGVWSRSRDLSTSDDFTGPIIVTVEEGTTYRNTFWHMLPASTITVGTDAVSFTTGYPPAQFGNGAALSVFGRASNSSGARADIAAANDGEVLRRSGTTVGFGTVVAAGLASDAVTTAKILDSNVTTAKIADSNVTTVKIADANVTKAKLENSSALSVIGRSANSSGVPADIAGTDGQVLRVSGTTLGFGTVVAAGLASDAVTTTKILDANVTKAKLENSAALSVIGRSANSSGVPADIAAASDGAILRRSGTSIGFGNASSAYVDYDQGGTNSVATTLQARQRLIEVCPEDFGCVGDGTTDDSTNFTRFLDALKVVSAASGAVLGRLRRVYAVSSQQSLTLWTGNITLIADAGAGIKTTGSGTYTGLYVAGAGATGSTFTISGSPAYGAETITLSAVTGLAVGDYCEIENATGYSSDARFMRNQIRAISGNDVTLEIPLAFSINSSNTTRFQEVALQSGFKCEGLTATHTGSGTVNGFSFFNLHEPQIINTRTANFNTGVSQGFVTYGIYGGLIDGVYDSNSGFGASSDAIVLGCTNTDILNVRSMKAAGFGIGITYTAACRLTNLTSIRSVGRGIKLFGACDNAIANVRVDGSGATYSGFAFSGGSAYNRVVNVVARRNNVGLWLNGTGNINNYFNGLELASNTTDLTVATTSPLDDTGNVFDNVSPRASVLSISTTSLPVIRTTRRSLARVKLTSDQTVAHSTNTKVAFATIVHDENGEFDTANNRFVCKWPGVYTFNARLGYSAGLSTNASYIYMLVNGSLSSPAVYNNSIANDLKQDISATLYLKKGDYVEILVNQTSGGDRTISSTDLISLFEGAML